jgi:hypothetical protein
MHRTAIVWYGILLFCWISRGVYEKEIEWSLTRLVSSRERGHVHGTFFLGGPFFFFFFFFMGNNFADILEPDLLPYICFKNGYHFQLGTLMAGVRGTILGIALWDTVYNCVMAGNLRCHSLLRCPMSLR